MNKLDKNSMVSDEETIKTLPTQSAQSNDSINTWDQLTDEQQQDILAHLTEVPFQ
ncbi:MULTISPECIES: hypothetical protein [Aliivibrio]|uniref:hypothetical protein n=1 Tax=Aliivibrio TaxID=511678 RepID=UPI001585E226|nr:MULTISPECIES: hypothetical protein [Aliivibrio]MBB1312752.1 hypothetical protein [Aliivibrio sp. SR45-2]